MTISRFAFPSLLVSSCLAIAAGTLALLPTEAQACGGTFCDTGPNVMPVDQTGENILFVREGGEIETHIQIQYDGDPERFAWVIPVMAEPTITVGSQALFDNLLAGTVPNFGTQSQFDCNDFGGPSFGCAMAAEDASGLNQGFGDSETGSSDDDGGGPDIVDRGVAGAFEYVVLSGGTVQGVVDWLDDNGYAQDEDAPPILEDYLERDFLFIAVKLQSGAGIEEIQPLVVRYEGPEPCLPIELTAIAAKDDMGIRAFFAGSERAVPTNYQMVEPNWAALDWEGFGANYDELVTMAVDETAQGHAWVTEYAGSDEIVSREGLLGWNWSAFAFSEASVFNVVDILESQNLMSCGSWGCDYWHPLVEPLLAQHIPVPEGVSPDAFYGCLECHEALIDVENWDPTAFAADFAERIVEPGKRAEDILDTHSYLTRLYTTMSPHEMTEDPTFHTNPDLGDYQPPRVAVQHIECANPDWTETPGGDVLHHDSSNNYPTSIDMPAARTIWSVPAMGAPQVVVDNSEAIDDAIRSWNKANPLHDEGNDCSVNRSARNQGLLSLAALFALMGIRRRRRES